MAMIYGLVKQHSGYIDLESEPGRGTTVRLFFPSVSATEERSEPATEKTSDLGGKDRILIVDDEDGIRRVLLMSGYTSGDFDTLSETHPELKILHKPWRRDRPPPRRPEGAGGAGRGLRVSKSVVREFRVDCSSDLM
jgi:hypothetical protein